MYSEHFGLSADPFSIAPDPRYLFMSERHREALAHLLYGVGVGEHAAGGGFVLLTGDIGTGKTTICRCFLEQIPPLCHVAYIFNPKLTAIELLQSICEEFHINVPKANAQSASAKDYIDALNTFLLQSHAAGHSSVLIIDEAQNLHSEVLEQLRLLTNLETNERKLLQIVLIGQPELRTMLARPELEQLAQRVIARFHLDALNPAESLQYIEHRLAIAGYTGALPFDPRAVQRIHQLTGGVPRRINLLCGRALLGAWAHGQSRVDRAVVDKAAQEVFGPESVRASGRSGVYLGWLAGAAALLALGLAAYLMWQDARDGAPAPTPARAQPDVAAPLVPPVPAASAAAPVPPPAAVVQDDGVALLAQLPSDMGNAWRDLATRWNITLPPGEPCQVHDALPLQCYRASDLSLPQLRRLGRPGIVSLQSGNERAVVAVLTGLGEHSATLQMGTLRGTVSLAQLARLWRGDFATFWRPPPGYSANLHDGSSGPAIEWLARALDDMDGIAPGSDPVHAAPTLDATLRQRVRAFQRAQGLKADGQPGPLTFMQLESAAATEQPRLQTEPR